MKLEDLVAISGMSGLFKMVGSRPNGMIVEELDSGKRRFIPSRRHQFSPLETISIFTNTDSVSLTDVLKKIHASIDTTPIIDANASPDDLREYFTKIIPDHDQNRVFPKDIKKIIKWYAFIKDRDLFTDSDEEE